MPMTATIDTAQGTHVFAPRVTRSVPKADFANVLRVLEPLGVVQYCRRDQSLYADGDLAEHWYKVVSGAVRTSKLMSDGRRQVGEILLPGDFFGFDALEIHSFGAEAVTEGTVVIRYPRRRIEMLEAADTRLNLRFRELAFDGLARAHTRLMRLGRMTAIERVASFVVEMMRRGAVDGTVIELPMARQDIADYLGLTVETVSRTLAELKRQGAIALPTPLQVEVRNEQTLERLAGMA